jgi:hypothetical protein
MGVTLLTANELANASNLASTIIMTAGVHPAFQLQTVTTADLLAQPLLRRQVDMAVQEGASPPPPPLRRHAYTHILSVGIDSQWFGIPWC